eukprot:CAMPEP_0206569964 /NCGR_PEP_ID=MMETSP0325_2-20121206/26744_1 /ASSEMBLY_ACC=CAM_ASM_000347 /TAXON_ID=2866 /ORGANISM="Crypthecodinium cohnii, Strain Seligo" /LENGTH=106 /DNA_ID=CAMNT_0054073639 /DNA_START=236 /DNA_END=556 /DNA_ORIENTATION=+
MKTSTWSLPNWKKSEDAVAIGGPSSLYWQRSVEVLRTSADSASIRGCGKCCGGSPTAQPAWGEIVVVVISLAEESAAIVEVVLVSLAEMCSAQQLDGSEDRLATCL